MFRPMNKELFMYNNNNDNELSVDMIDAVEELSHVRPASQSPDVSVQELECDDLVDDDEFIDIGQLSALPACVIKQKLLTAPVVDDYLPTSTPKLPNPSMTTTNNNNNQTSLSSLTDTTTTKKADQFDDFLSSQFKGDIEKYKHLRQTRLTKFLSAPVASCSTSDAGGANVTSQEDMAKKLISAPVVPSCSSGINTMNFNPSAVATTRRQEPFRLSAAAPAFNSSSYCYNFPADVDTSEINFNNNMEIASNFSGTTYQPDATSFYSRGVPSTPQNFPQYDVPALLQPQQPLNNFASFVPSTNRPFTFPDFSVPPPPLPRERNAPSSGPPPPAPTSSSAVVPLRYAPTSIQRAPRSMATSSDSSSSVITRTTSPTLPPPPGLSLTNVNRIHVQQEQYQKLMAPATNKRRFIDSHCHLDMVFTKYNFNDSFNSFKNKYKSTWSPNFVGCITDFCCPATYSNGSNFFEEILENEEVYGAIGCHPLEVMSYESDTEAIISVKSLHPKVVALGEMGLDYSSKNCTHSDRETQKCVLERQLMFSVREINKPIILHCREADDDCLAIMQRLVHHDYPIHWHCFSGNKTSIQKWQYFTNLYFGVTTGIGEAPPEILEFFRTCPLNRILLETNAPYFLPSHYRHKTYGGICLEYNHPGMGALAAFQLAELRNKSPDEIFDQVYQNTFQLYTDLKFTSN